ncbi:hypothetical protein GCM10022252_26740 [Streptosporangium oxazolinicum]|uniref:Uncharacterized protein n=1 Tax=Streptosporangium oxazolinicum TaxID=909287 RepID=A0ABP8ASR4_9ACTN
MRGSITRKEDACYAAELGEISRGRRLTDVTTDGTADTQEVDVASHDEQWVRWHVYDDTSDLVDVQCRVHHLDADVVPGPRRRGRRGHRGRDGLEADHPSPSQFTRGSEGFREDCPEPR